MRLGAWVSGRPALLGLLRGERDEELVAALEGEGRALWQTFLLEFGGRCYQELLLTSPTFEERPDSRLAPGAWGRRWRRSRSGRARGGGGRGPQAADP